MNRCRMLTVPREAPHPPLSGWNQRTGRVFAMLMPQPAVGLDCQENSGRARPGNRAWKQKRPDCVVFGMITQAAVQAPPPPAQGGLPPLPPLPPATPAAPGVPVPAGPAMTFAELVNLPRRALLARRDELSRQLTSASGRREDLVQELRSAPTEAVRNGLESRIALLDQRILQLEQDIAINGQALAARPTEATTVQSPRGGFGRPGGNSDRMEVAAGILAAVLLVPVAIATARRIWRGSPAPVVHRDSQNDARLERIEQAVDAIAIEVERISEAQRFQNKLLSEGQAAGLFGFARVREGEKALG